MRKATTILLLLFALCFSVVIAQRKVTPVESAGELKTMTKEELKAMRQRKAAVAQLSDSALQDSLRRDSIEKAKRPVLPLLMSASAGVNIWDPLMRMLGQSYGGASVWAALNLKNRFIPTAEIGIGMANSTPDDGNFTYKGKAAFFAKIGMNYNFFFSKNPKYQFYLGLRGAWSSFRYDILDVSLNNSYWGGNATFDIRDQKSHAFWGEIRAGLQVEIYRNFSIGWALHYNLLFDIKDTPNSRPWYIPGYGTRDNPINVSLSVAYTLPLTKDKKKDAGNVLEDGIDGSGAVRPDSIIVPERIERVPSHPESAADHYVPDSLRKE